MNIWNRKEFWLKILVDSEYTYTDIDEQLVKEEWIKIALLPRPFNTFNSDRTKSGNHKVT